MKNTITFIVCVAIALASGEAHYLINKFAESQAAPVAPAPVTITATDALGHVKTGTATWTAMQYNANAITIAYTHDTLSCNGFEP